MPARSEKVAASVKDPGACLGLGHRGLGVGEARWLREEKIWANLP